MRKNKMRKVKFLNALSGFSQLEKAKNKTLLRINLIKKINLTINNYIQSLLVHNLYLETKTEIYTNFGDSVKRELKNSFISFII